MQLLRYEVVDVFAERPYAGNPLAVVLDGDDLPAAAMQAMAREFHLSETAFPLRPTVPGAAYRVRIFTPVTELPFAGHPSIGTAWVLARLGRIGTGSLRQESAAGVVPVHVEDGPGRVTLTGAPPYVGPVLRAEPLLAAVGLAAGDLAGPPPRLAGAGLDFGYLHVQPDAVARAVRGPGLDAAAAGGAVGIVVVAYADGRAHARMFDTSFGIGEDPATGAAALGLGAYLVASGLAAAEGETAYVVSQGAEIGRPSVLEGAVRAADGRAIDCRVAGRVVPVARGEIRAP